MRQNKIKIFLLLFAGMITISTAGANPGFNVVVSPIASTVMPGEIAKYSVTISAIDTLKEEEFVDLSVVDLAGNQISWNTRFSENRFKIGPYPSEKIVTLEIDVPAGTPVGEYLQKIKGEGYLPDLIDPTQPDTILGVIESSEFPITVSVTQIPEFPTMALPIVSALGIMLLMSRRKKN